MKKSTIERTVISLCPTPIVSTKIISNPAASQSSIVSLVFLVTPPNVPPDGDGLMKAFFWRESFSILVLSPSIEPLLRVLLGSIARTATLCLFWQR